MKENLKFGAKLRELRTKSGLSLRELADKVNVDFTYLSKIENGVMPPPSEKVIRQLAETLNADKDELLTLAGIIPSDIAEILKDRDTLRKLRAERAKKEEKALAVHKKLVSIPQVSIPLKGLYRLALPVFLVIAVAASLWFASPTKALFINYPSLPTSGTLGSVYTFTVNITIEDNELLPLQQVDIRIYKSDDETNYKATLSDLPKWDSSQSSHTIDEGSTSGTATVAANADANWEYFHGTGNVTWQGGGYTFTPSPSYGYGYQSGTGPTTITYTIKWTPPSSSAWAGTYKVKTTLTTSTQSPGGGTTFTETSSAFTLTAAAAPAAEPVYGPGGGAPAAEELTGEDLIETGQEDVGQAGEDLIETGQEDPEEAGDALIEGGIEQPDVMGDVLVAAGEKNTQVAGDVLVAAGEKNTQVAGDVLVAAGEKNTKVAGDILVAAGEKNTKVAGSILLASGEKNTKVAGDVLVAAGEKDAKVAGAILGKVSDDNAEIAGNILDEVADDSAEVAGSILDETDTSQAVVIIENSETDTLNVVIPNMSEISLTKIIPDLSTDKQYSIKPGVFFKALPNAPTEQLLGEKSPEPPADLEEPTTVYDMPTGGKYVSKEARARNWCQVTGALAPVEKLLIKTNKALKDIGTTLEISEQQPPEALVMLPFGQIAKTYMTITFENAAPEDIELGHTTFYVEKEWLEENSIHKWSVSLYRYSPELNKWLALPTKRVKEDDTYIYYTATVTRFSTFAISGSEALPAIKFESSNLSISPTEAESGEAITISADITNTSDSTDTYVATLWLNNTVEAGQDVNIEAGKTEAVSFTVTPAAEGSYEVRIDRLLGSFSVSKPAPLPPAPAPPAPPEKPPAPAPAPPPEKPPAPPPAAPPVTPVTPVTPINWWLIGGIIAVVIIIGVVVWLLVIRRRA
jgi:PGF-pre-PGF domain-containing protein